ncbi:MAG: hypothetical protein MCS20_01050 [Candidatus Phytoplasma mali]|nr:hypothetical protein [Candidatus Phytoplasma mali]
MWYTTFWVIYKLFLLILFLIIKYQSLVFDDKNYIYIYIYITFLRSAQQLFFLIVFTNFCLKINSKTNPRY